MQAMTIDRPRKGKKKHRLRTLFDDNVDDDDHDDGDDDNNDK